MIIKVTNALRSLGPDLGLVLMRIAFGGLMALNHGWPKLMKFSAKSGSFAPWFPLPSTLSYALTVFAELGCAVLVVVGLGTRVACLPLVFTMLVAAFGAHGDSILGDGEHALLFAAAFFGIALTGPGKHSADAMLFRSRA